MRDCPVLRPTLEDIQGPFEAFIEKHEKKIAEAGIAKIVAPEGWSPRRQGYPDDLDFIIERPIRQHATGTRGLYRGLYIEEKPMSLRRTFRPQALAPENQPPAAVTPADLERKYWKNVTLRPPLYGADVLGSLFDEDCEGWNLRRLDTVLSRVLHLAGHSLPGVSEPYLYFGTWRSTFAWHTEDMDLYSVNYLHYGAPKQWYCIPPDSRRRFELLIRGMLPDLFRACPEFFRHKELIISPQLLDTLAIPYIKTVQQPREFVINYPGAYHAGYNLGYNCAESVNFGTRRWVPVGARASVCQCNPDSVTIDMRLFRDLVPPGLLPAFNYEDSEGSEEGEGQGHGGGEGRGHGGGYGRERGRGRGHGRPRGRGGVVTGGGRAMVGAACWGVGEGGGWEAASATGAWGLEGKEGHSGVGTEEEGDGEEEGEGEEQGSPRGTKRRRRWPTAEAEAADWSNPQGMAVVAAAPPRRRGRPPKAATLAAAAAATASVAATGAAAAATATGAAGGWYPGVSYMPGLDPAAAAAALGTGTALRQPAEAADAPAAPRRRGRPPKRPTVMAVAAATGVNAVAASEAVQPGPALVLGPGAGAGAVLAAAAAFAAPPPPVKRPRGRPRKHPLPPSQAATDAGGATAAAAAATRTRTFFSANADAGVHAAFAPAPIWGLWEPHAAAADAAGAAAAAAIAATQARPRPLPPPPPLAGVMAEPLLSPAAAAVAAALAAAPLRRLAVRDLDSGPSRWSSQPPPPPPLSRPSLFPAARFPPVDWRTAERLLEGPEGLEGLDRGLGAPWLHPGPMSAMLTRCDPVQGGGGVLTPVAGGALHAGLMSSVTPRDTAPEYGSPSPAAMAAWEQLLSSPGAVEAAAAAATVGQGLGPGRPPPLSALALAPPPSARSAGAIGSAARRGAGGVSGGGDDGDGGDRYGADLCPGAALAAAVAEAEAMAGAGRTWFQQGDARQGGSGGPSPAAPASNGSSSSGRGGDRGGGGTTGSGGGGGGGLRALLPLPSGGRLLEALGSLRPSFRFTLKPQPLARPSPPTGR